MSSEVRVVFVCIAVYVDLLTATTAADFRELAKQTSGYLEISGCKIYYEHTGSGRAVILLHDGSLNAATWDEVWPALAAKYHVIRYDRRAYGRSELPTSPYSSTDDLLKLMQHLDVPHAVLVGCSSGGALAIDFAIEHPDMVDGLFLISPVLHGISYTDEFRERANRNNEPMRHNDLEAVARNWAQDRFLVSGAKERVRKKIYEELVAASEKLKFEDRFEERLTPPASDRLSEVKAPTLVLTGEADIRDVHAHSAAIAAGIRGSVHLSVKDAGHLIQLEQPDEVVKGLENFADRRAEK